MVINENFNSDVVFLIEATAHISPYVESLKTNYIIPTLEYFSGTLSDERDFSADNVNSTLYGIVTFMSMDCKPDSASICYAPTSNSHTFLQWLDKIQFIGGAGDPSSHIVEGLCTAINVLDDFKSFREKCDMPNNMKSLKYCILICNSTPYLEPSIENPVYCGYTIDQLMNIMTEKNINFSVFSPRKMNFLYKLFENSGGNLSNALSKNYAKDRRHLVLLNGFHLQEKPVSPISQPSSTEPDKSQQGMKRSLSPNSNSMLPSQQMISRNQPINSIISSDTSPFPQHSKIPDNIVRGGSPLMSHWANNGNVPSPSQGQRNSTHPPVRARASTPQMNNTGMQNMNPSPSPGQLPNLVSQASPAPKSSQVNQNQAALRPNNPIRPQQTMQSPFPTPQAPSPSQPQPSPHGMRPVPSPIQNSTPSPISQSQQFMQQPQMSQQQQQHMTQIAAQQGQAVANMNQMNMQNNITPMPQGMINNQRTRIWNGIIEYQDKSHPQAINNPQGKISYSLECQITYQPNNNEPEFTAERWPDKLLINTVPRNLMNRLSPIFKNNSYHVNFHFTNDSHGLQSLCKAMSTNLVGCIQLPNPANIRIIIVFYMSEKKLFVGFIPHNQDEFMSSMKELIESHKKEQQVKQKMLMQHQQQQMQQQSQSPSIPSSQMSNTNPVVQISGGQMPIQIMHGQMGQTAHSNASQIMTPSNQSTMFQLQQIGTMPNNVNMTPNLNINTIAQSNSIPMQSNTTSGNNILLNQNLVNISNQQKNNFHPNSSNANIIATSNAGGIQIINTSQASGISQLQGQNQQIIQQQNSSQQSGQQQFNMMQNNGQQIGSTSNNQNNMNAAARAQFMPNERDSNILSIKQLEQTVNTVDQQQQPQMIQNSLQQQNSTVVRQHLQQHMQQKQMIHLQQQQQQQQQPQHQVNAINNNAQLRHLLQQQQMRTMNPSRMNLTQGSVGVQQQQQSQQPQMMLQQTVQMSQPQPFRFQSSIQNQQQQQPPPPQATNSQIATQQRSNFYDDSIY